MKGVYLHDWLVELGGSEQVLQTLYQLNPMPIKTLFSKKDTEKKLGFLHVEKSILNRLPRITHLYRLLFPFFPIGVFSLSLKGFDMVISSSFFLIKNIPKAKKTQCHICYCHTPARILWDRYECVVKKLKPFPLKWLYKVICSFLRNWDYRSSKNIDYFVANSSNVAARIKRYYQRDVDQVIYPPVDVNYFSEKHHVDKEKDLFVVCSRLVDHKHVDIIVKAFADLSQYRLVVIGTGPEKSALERMKTDNVLLKGFVSRDELRQDLRRARAFIFAADEDFGIAPVEALAAGTPVIAYGKGGVLETVIPDKTGIFFDQLSPESLKNCIKKFVVCDWNPLTIIQHAQKFSKERFEREWQEFLERIDHEGSKPCTSSS